MSHDLQFSIENGGSFRPEQPVRGEMDHLPESTSTALPTKPSSLQYIQDQLKQSAHPVVIIFHVLFKGAALALYLFGGLFLGSGAQKGAHFVALSVAIILLLAADFWVVKNVTGRLLVGLRWWNKVNEDSTTWIFEAAENQVVNAFDKRMFWTVLYATPAVWSALLVLAVMKFNFSWLMIVGIALSLSGSNVYGYYKCSTDQEAKFKLMMKQGAEQGVSYMMRSSILSMVTGASGGGPSATYV
jgi:hypothetical protein